MSRSSVRPGTLRGHTEHRSPAGFEKRLLDTLTLQPSRQHFDTKARPSEARSCRAVKPLLHIARACFIPTPSHIPGCDMGRREITSWQRRV